MTPAPEPAGLRALLTRLGLLLVRLPAPLAWGLVAAWTLLIWTLGEGTFQRPPEVDSVLFALLANLTHAPLFGLLALLVAGALSRSAGARRAADLPRLGGRRAGLVLLWVLATGALDEWHQSTTPGRDASALDVVTDLVGAGCVLWIAAYLGGGLAGERGLRRRLLAGVGLCVVAAALVTFARA